MKSSIMGRFTLGYLKPQKCQSEAECTNIELTQCRHCQKLFCEAHIVKCLICGNTFCSHCFAIECPVCNAESDVKATCTNCGAEVSVDHIHPCPDNACDASLCMICYVEGHTCIK